MSCKIHDAGGTDAIHYGHGVGGGLYIAKEDDGSVTICRHPGDAVRAVPDVAITLTATQWAAAVAGMGKKPGQKAARARKPKGKGGKKGK